MVWFAYFFTHIVSWYLILVEPSISYETTANHHFGYYPMSVYLFAY